MANTIFRLSNQIDKLWHKVETMYPIYLKTSERFEDFEKNLKDQISLHGNAPIKRIANEFYSGLHKIARDLENINEILDYLQNEALKA